MELRTEIRERLRRSSDWAAAIEELEAELEQLEDAEQRSERLFELAQLTEEVVPERDRALAIYQRAWKVHPPNIKALQRARQVYHELGRLEMVAKVGQLELKSAADETSAARIAAMVGRAMLDCGNAEKAAPLLQMATNVLADDVEARDALAAASYDREIWQDVVAKLESDAESADSTTAARMLLRAARILQIEAPDDPAYEATVRKVVENDPQNESGNYMLESLLARTERWDELETHHEKRAYAAADDAEAARLYTKFALEWVQRFKDRERGAKFFQRAMDAAAQNGAPPPGGQIAAFYLMREVFGARAEWDRVFASTDAVLGQLDDDRRLHIALQAGLVAWKNAGDTARARAYFDVVRAIDPDNAELAVFEAEHPAAASGAAVAIEEDDGKKKKKGKKRRGKKDSVAPDEVVEAAPVPEIVQAPAPEPEPEPEPAPAPEPARAAPAAAAEALPPSYDEDTGEDISGEQQAAIDAARKLEAGGGAPDKVIDAWRKAVDVDGGKRAPRRQLARVLRQHERWNALVEALKDEEKSAAVTGEQKVAVLGEMADVYRDKMRLDVMVVKTLDQILQHDPGNLQVIDTLAAQYEAMKRWPDLVSTLGRKVELLADPAERVALHLQIANLYIDKFSNQAEAIKAFESVLEIDPHNAEAVSHLEAVYEKRRDWEKLIALRERDVERTDDPTERARKTLEIAQLAATRLKKPAVCIVWWEKVREFEPANDEALKELEKFYERDKEWERLAEICKVKAEHSLDAKERVDAFQKLGLLYQDKISNTDAAIDAWRALLEVEPEHRRAQDALKKLYIEAKNWDALEEFYRASDKLDEYVRVLEREVDRDDQPLPLAMKIAMLYRDEIDKSDRAMRAFEKVLQIDERNLQAAEALIPLYEEGRDPRKLVPVLEIQLDATDDADLRRERMIRLAEHCEDKMRDKGAAYGWWLKALAENHADVAIREQTERLAQETGGWTELVEAYEHAIEEFGAKSGDKHDALPLMLVVARVLENELGELDRALETNRAILDIDDSNEAALAALERLYLGKQQYEDLLDIYRRKLDLTLDGDARTQIQYKIGQLYEDEVKDDDKAADAYNAILDANGDDLSALGALDRLHTRNQRWSELANVLERQLVLVGPDQLEGHVGLKYRLGQVRESHMGDGAGALECYREILDLDRAHDGARAALERRLDDPDNRLMAANILEPIYEELEDWRNLIRAHEIQIGEADQFRKVGLLMRIGELSSKRLGDAEAAFDAFARAFKADPSHGGAKAELEELSGLIDDGWPKLVALFEAAVNEGELDPGLLHELSLKVAAAYEVRLDDTDKAVDYYRRALSVEPDDATAIEALDRIFTANEQWADLLEIYRKKADISSDASERLGILFRVASIQEEMLHNTHEAIAAYNEILAQDGENLHALRALDRLYVHSEQWHELGDNLTRQLALCDEDYERVKLLVRLAQLRENQLAETAAAVETYRQVIELAPDNFEAIAALERLIAHEDHELTIAQILEPIYRALAQWEKQIGVYEIMARHAYDPERKIELLHNIAELYEVGGDDGRSAFTTYARALREEPRNDGTRAQLDRLSRMLGNWNDLVQLYDEIATDLSDEELKIQLLTKLAQIYELELGNDRQAVATYDRILQTSPQHIDAASAIQAVHERNADYPALVGALKRKAEIVLDLPARKDLLYKAAQIQEEVLEDADGAIATYRYVLDQDDIDAVSLDALERLYIRLERWEPLKDVYQKKADLADEPDRKKQMLYVLGQVYDRELGDVGKAIETYQAILDIDAEELSAIQALDRLFGQAERWYDLLQNLETQVELAEITGEQVGLKYRIGQLWQHQLNDLARSIEAYREALQLDPSHPETLAALDALLRGEDGEPAVMAARVLEPIHEAQAEYGRLVDVLEVMVKHAEDPVQRVELLHRLAGLHEYRLERYDAAFDAYRRALREDSGDETTLGHLERLADVTRFWQPLAELYLAEADKSLDVPRQVDLLSRLARIHEQELGRVEDAIETYKRILDVEFDNAPAVLALDRLYSATERWQELTDILRKEIQLADSDEQVVELQFRLGQTLEQALRELPAAIDVYRDILTANPEHGPTIGALEMMFLEGHHELEIAGILEPLYQTAGEWEKLHKIYEVQLSKLTEANERMSMYQRLAELAEQQLYDQRRASFWWGAAVVEDPQSELAIEEAERLARETAAWVDLVDVYIRVLEQHAERDVQRATLLRLGRVYEAELSEPVSATETYLRVLEIDPKDGDALAALDRLYEAAAQYEELVEILRRRIEVTLDGDEIIELEFRRGYYFAEALNDLDASLACYESILEQDTRNRRALEAEEAIYFRREAWPQLYGVYEKLVDVAENDAELADVYARMARIAMDALDNEEGAIDYWTRVSDIRGEDPMALSALGQLYARREMWSELVEVIEREVHVTGDRGQQIALYKRLGRVWEHRLGRERNALEAWLQAYELDPQDLETLQTLAHLYRETQSWEELSQALRQILELAAVTGALHEQQVIEYYAQLGQLEGEILGRVNDAVEAWRRVLMIDPTDFRALGALEQLFTREARWEECIDVLEKRAAVLDDMETRIDTLLQAGAIWEEKVGDHHRAADTYERVRAYDASNAIASAQLETIYREQYNWEKLTEILLERVEFTQEKYDRIEILQRVAKIYEEEVGDQESAFVVLQAAFREDYAHESTAREMERLATAAGKWEDLLADYTEVVQALESEDADSACDLWVKIGRWYGDHLSHIDYAIHSVSQALRINPDHSGALSALADFQRKRGSWGELIETLSKHAAVEQDTEKKVDLYLSLAELLETQIMDPVQAMSAYQNALAADPECNDALVALDRLYRRHEMWEPLIDVIGRRAQLADDTDAIRLRLEIGRLWDEMIVDSGQAIAAYQTVIDQDSSNLHALRALERLYEKTGQSEKYLDVLEAQLDASPTDAEQIALYERMASAWEERFGKLDRASECLEKIVAIDDRNYQAYRELARLYQAESKWDSLVDVYRRHIMAINDPGTRVNLYCAMGQVYEDELADYDRAIEAYTDVLTFDPDDARALDALGRLYERIEEWDRAIQVMGQLVQATHEPAKQVDLYHRIGRITYSYLGEPEQAEEQFLHALAINDTHVPTMEDLVRLYSDRGDWLKAANMMVKAETYTANALDKVRLLYDAAAIYEQRLGKPDQALQYYAAVLAIDPEHVEAGEPLAQLYFKRKNWTELSPVLDMLVRKSQQRQMDTRDLNDLYYMVAKTSEELGEFEKASNFYKAAYDLDSTYLPTLIGRADLLYKMGDWEGAGKIYQTILVQHRDSQDEGAVVRIYNALGNVRLQLGERRKALNMFEKALEIDPYHADTLNVVIDIQAAQGDYEAVIQAKRALMQQADEDARIKLLDEIGGIYLDNLNNEQKSIAAYLEALELRPGDHSILQKVLDLYTRTKNWKKAVEVIERFAELESNSLRKGKYYQAAGTICRDELKALDQAIDYYNRALDCFYAEDAKIPQSALPGCLKAFMDIDKIVTSKRDWKQQEREYRKMIKRLPPGDKILVDLWHSLGEIYRSRLKHYQSAIQAYEVATGLDPENRQRNEILAELYIVAGPEYADKAVAQHMTMLKADPYKYDSYKSLRRIYMDSHQYDKTWCVCSTLAFLNKADPEEMQFYEQYKPRGFVKAKQRMTEEVWRKVYHPDEDLYIGAILAAVHQAAAAVNAKPHKDFGLKRKDKRNVANDQLQFSKIFYYVSQVLNVPPPEVYLQPEQQGEILLANTIEKNMLIPSFVVRANLLQGRAEREIAFVTARKLAYMRPEHYLKLATTTNTELKAALLSAIHMVQPRFPIPADGQQLVAQYEPHLQKKVTPAIKEQLAQVVARFLQHAGKIDLSKWGNAVDLTTQRVGFIICGDLAVAAQMVSMEPPVVGGLQVKDKIKELVLFSVSEEYFAARQHLGTTIG